ncbi:otoraplin [Sorex araneus]|uniref:otoraplin n=1 Tax=Sorex araneus TaxID=42254 RepID=UPI002433F323|nr:otoraplin [Sorex araneus]
MAKGSLLFLLGLLALGTVHGSFMGKLASKKICADDVCEYKNMYTISLARAQKMYEGPDCRFLSFSEGQQIYIYSKLVKEDEEDEEYWAASVYVQCLLDQRGNIGYFPSNLVEEIQVFKEATKELPTTVTFQKSPSQQAYYADSEIVGKVRYDQSYTKQGPVSGNEAAQKPGNVQERHGHMAKFTLAKQNVTDDPPWSRKMRMLIKVALEK